MKLRYQEEEEKENGKEEGQMNCFKCEITAHLNTKFIEIIRLRIFFSF